MKVTSKVGHAGSREGGVPSVVAMRAAAGQATHALRALAHEDRLMLLCQLTQGECSVGELEQLLNIRQPSLSQQLGVLRNEGLVLARRDGTRIHYSIADQSVVAILNVLYQLYCTK
jgi:DNA-binding transcriptional ArsR family regulator